MYQLKLRQICLFFIAIVPVTKLFMLPSILAGIANEDMWISALLSMLLDGLTITAIIFACKKTETDFYTLLEINFGKIGSKIILGLYLIFFILKSILPINEQKNYVELTLYDTAPNIFTFAAFFITSFYLSIKSLKTIGRISDVLWVLTVFASILLFSLSASNTDFTAVLPIGARGAKNILKGSYTGANWFGDSAYFLFFLGAFKYEKKSMLKLLLSFGAAAINVLLYMVVFYGIFQSIAFRELFALSEISKFGTGVNNVGRFDYMGILMIIFSTVFALSMPLYFATEILTKIFGFKSKFIPSLIVNGSVFLIIVLLEQYFASIQHFLLSYGSAFFIIMANILPVFTLFLRKRKQYEKNTA